MNSKSPTLVKVARIAGAHGIRGQVKLQAFIEPAQLKKHKALKSSKGNEFHITIDGGKSEALVVSIKGVDDRNAAELLRGTELYAPESILPKKKKNEWYADELVGLEARLENGKTYGTVASVNNFGAGDIIEITLSSGKNEMIPFKPAFIGDVFPDKGFLVVIPPDYIESKKND